MQVPVHRQPARVVDPLREAQSVAAGRVAVLLSAVELVLLLVEAVHKVARAATRQPVRVTHAGRRSARCRIGAGPSGRSYVAVYPERVAVVRRPPLVEEVAVEGGTVGPVRVLALV